jgi:RNA polymerase sigma-70 factor (ECF subfamily)
MSRVLERENATSLPEPEQAKEKVLQELLAHLGGGDERAHGDFYDLTKRRVFGLAGAILRNGALAEEATLDVYTQVWRSAGSYDVLRGSVWSWLFRLARTRAIDALRRRARERSRYDAIEEARNLPAPGEPALEGTARAESADAVRTALALLPDPQREAILVAYFRGLSYVETAEALRLPEGTVKTRIRNGLLALRRLLASTDQGRS